MIRRPAFVLALLTGLNLLNYLDRFVLSAVLPRIERDLSLDHGVAGLLGTIFLVGYFMTSPIFGTLADRGRRTGLLAFGIVVWSLATVASGLATGVVSLAIARVFVGVGEASYATIAPTMIDDLAPAGRKSTWLAIFYAASPIGSALGYVTGGLVEHAMGWRAAFFVAGGPGLLLGVACLLLKDPERRAIAKPGPIARDAAPADSHPALRPRRPGVRGVHLRHRRLRLLGPDLPLPALRAHGPLPPRREPGDGRRDRAGWGPRHRPRRVLGGPGHHAVRLAAVDAEGGPERPDGRGLPPRLVAPPRLRHRQRHRRAPRGARHPLPTPLLFFVAFFFCEVAVFLSTSPINAAVLEAVPPTIRASAMALCIFGIHILGDLWSPPGVGVLADVVSMPVAMLVLPVAILASALVWWRPAARPAVA